MGSCSNRSMTQEKKLSEYVKEISKCKDTSNFDFQISTGAKIRGELGVEKGNKFIETIKNLTNK